jgi:hypothetical protein
MQRGRFCGNSNNYLQVFCGDAPAFAQKLRRGRQVTRKRKKSAEFCVIGG